MKWYNPLTWFENARAALSSEGSFAEVVLDYGFGRIIPAKSFPPFAHTLHITDLSAEDAKDALNGKQFDWHEIHSHWRHNLEIGGQHKATWSEVQQYLREWK